MSPGCNNHSRSYTDTPTNLSSSSSQYYNIMPTITCNKSGSASRKYGSSGRKASSKRLDKENAELKRKLAQCEAEEAQKTIKKPPKDSLTAKKPPEDPKIPSLVLKP
jgi:hypothetical protein